MLDAAYSDYVSKNDYELGIELAATTENTVLTHTFSKMHGLAALRVGWMFGPAHIVDAVNRIRGPFNVSVPAMMAAVAAIEDTAHVQTSREFTEKWRARLTDEFTKLGLKVTPSVANFVLIHFPDTPGKTAADADAFLTKRGLVLRAVKNYGLPNALRMTIGVEEANTLVIDRTARIHGGPMSAAPLFKRITLIGLGLIGSSLARGVKQLGLAGELVATDGSADVRARAAEIKLADRIAETMPRRCKTSDLIISCVPGRASPAMSPKSIAPHLKPGAIVSDVGSVKAAVLNGDGRASAGQCAFHSGASGRRHGEFRPGFRLRRTVHQSLVHSDATGWR